MAERKEEEIIYYNSSDNNTTTKIIYGYKSKNTLGTNSKINQQETHTLPFKVKKIKCSGEYYFEYNIYWTTDNKVYLVTSELAHSLLEKSKSFNCVKFIDKNNSDLVWKFYEINLNKFLKNENNNNFIKNIKCSGNCISFELNDKKVIVMDCGTIKESEVKFYEYSFPNLKRIKRGCVSNHLVFLMNNNEMKWIDTTELNEYKFIDLPTFTFGNIKHLALANTLLFIITDENKMYGFGSDSKFDFNSVLLNETEWTYTKTIFENESKVKSMKCGYSHCVVLLENGNIYGCGLNNAEQAGQPTLNNNILPTFMKFAFPITLIDKIESIYCMSIGTILQTSKEFICIGQIAWDCGSNLGDIHVARLERKFNINHVTTGPWHCLFYHKDKYSSKGIIYFLNNLQNMVKHTFSLSDIDILTE
ncbi:hypothetical protein ABK040_007700 [Willaertia magna]